MFECEVRVLYKLSARIGLIFRCGKGARCEKVDDVEAIVIVIPRLGNGMS